MTADKAYLKKQELHKTLTNLAGRRYQWDVLREAIDVYQLDDAATAVYHELKEHSFVTLQLVLPLTGHPVEQDGGVLTRITFVLDTLLRDEGDEFTKSESHGDAFDVYVQRSSRQPELSVYRGWTTDTYVDLDMVEQQLPSNLTTVCVAFILRRLWVLTNPTQQ